MSEWIRFLITPAVCGLIGYFTNWLAIKMLFRPRNEKRVFGFRIPLTPGVLPKSKARMAASIGSTVGEYLLTEESIKEAILSVDMNESVESFIDSVYKKLAGTEKTVAQVMDSLLGESAGQMSGKAADALYSKLCAYIEKEENITAAAVQLQKILCETLKNADIKLYYHNIIEKTDLFVEEKGGAYLNSQEFKNQVSLWISGLYERAEADQRPLGAVLPEMAVNGIKQAIVDKTPEASALFQKIILHNDTLNEKLLELVKRVVEDSVGQFLGGFVYKRVYDSIRENVTAYLSSTENMAAFATSLNKYLDEMLEKNAAYFMAMVKDRDQVLGFIETKALELAGSLDVDQIYGNFRDYAGNALEGILKENSPYDLIIRFCPDFDQKLRAFIEDRIKDLYALAGKQKLRAAIDLAAEKVLNFKVRKLTRFFGQEELQKLKVWVLGNEKLILSKASELVANKLRVPEIIENKINELDVEQLEALVLNVASRELKYITVMGGVLGTILGFIPEILNRLV